MKRATVVLALAALWPATYTDAQICLAPQQQNVVCRIGECVGVVSVMKCASWFNYTLSCTWEGNLVSCCDGFVNDYSSGICGGIQVGPTRWPASRSASLDWAATETGGASQCRAVAPPFSPVALP